MAIATTSITEVANNGNGTWLDTAGGGGSSANTDVFVTGGGSRARKVSNTTRGFAFDLGAGGTDISGQVIGIKWAVLAGVGSLGLRSAGGVELWVQDTSGNDSYWYVDGSDTYTGGWKFSVVDMARGESANGGTAATLTAARYIGMRWTTNSNVGGGDPNCYIDQILYWPQAGVTLTGNSTSFIDDLVDTIDNPANGPYFIFERRSGQVFSKARIILDPDATDMSDTDRTLVFENPVYYDGTNIDSCLVEVGMESTNDVAGELMDFTRCSFIAADEDETATALANREFDFTTSGQLSMDTCLLVGFDGTVMHLGDSANSYDDCTFQRCSEIVDTGAVVRRGFVRDSQCAATEAALLWTSSSDWQDTEFVMGVTNSHAMEIEGSADFTDSWNGFTFTGYSTSAGPTSVGNEVLINNVTGGANTVTINASDITGTISFRENGGADTVINNNVTLTFTGLKDNTEIRVYDQSGNELDGIENATAGSPDDRSFAASVAGSTVVDIMIMNLEWTYPPRNRIEDFTWPSATATLPIQQVIDRTYENP